MRMRRSRSCRRYQAEKGGIAGERAEIPPLAVACPGLPRMLVQQDLVLLAQPGLHPES